MPGQIENLTLGQKQRLFSKLVGQLIEYIYAQGYEVSLDWCYRPPEVAAYYASIGKGIRSSLHTEHLAIDLNLFKDGVFLTAASDHKVFGEFWKTLDPFCCWGGDFATQDGNHYSIEHNGIK